MLTMPATRWLGTRADESHRASARLRSGDALDVVDLRACALEIQRVIGPAACMMPGAREATATFPGIAVDRGPLVGFVAVDDGTRAAGPRPSDDRDLGPPRELGRSGER